MHITNSIITFSKEAQTLENVKELGVLTDRELVRALRDAIIAEEGAINQYETIVDSTSNEEAKIVLQAIADEEKVHVGELQELLKNLLPDEEDHLEEDADEVKEWGLDIPVFEDFSDKNQELDVNGFEDEMIIKLKYSEDDYEQVREQLSKISATPEQAVWKLLGNE